MGLKREGWMSCAVVAPAREDRPLRVDSVVKVAAVAAAEVSVSG